MAAEPTSQTIRVAQPATGLRDGLLLLAGLGGILAQFVPARNGYILLGNLALNQLLMLPVLALALAYGLGLRRLGAEALAWRRQPWAWAGLALLLVVVGSTLDYLGHELLTAHMLEYMLLTLLVAPLLIWGQLGAALAAVPGMKPSPPGLRPAAAVVGIWVLNTLVLWGWHWTPLYELAIRSQPLSALKHASFLVAALLFWRVVLLPPPGQERPAYGLAIALAVATMLQSAALGALLSMLPTPAYPFYQELARLCNLAFCTLDAGQRRPFGLSLLVDQQLAGLLMWIPGGMAYLALIVGIGAAWMQSERR